MAALFAVFLNMTITAGWAILLVLAARLLLRPVPRIFSYVLWAVVLFRLLCPVSLSGGFSLPAPLDSAVSEGGQLTYFSAPEPSPLPAGTEAEVISPVSGEEDAASEASPMDWAARVWLAGAVVLLLWGVGRLLRLRRRLREAVPLGDRVWCADGVSTPFVLGIFRPRIYLPAGLREEETAYILCHEDCHIRRGDHLFRLLAYAALCLHWYNPLVWLAFFLSGRDMELSCDEAVLRKMGRDIRGDYASSLLRLSSPRPGFFSPAFGEGDTALRIRRVMTGRPVPRWALALSLGAVLVLLALLAVNPPDRRSDFYRWTEDLSPSSLSPAGDLSISRFYALATRYQLSPGDLEEVTALFRALNPDDVCLSSQPGEAAEYRLNLFPAAGGDFIFQYDPGRPRTLSLLCDSETAADYDFGKTGQTVTIDSPALAAFLLERLPPTGTLEAVWSSGGATEAAAVTDGSTITQVLTLLARGEPSFLPGVLSPSGDAARVTLTLSTRSETDSYRYGYTLLSKGERWLLRLEADGTEYLLSREDVGQIFSLLGLTAAP